VLFIEYLNRKQGVTLAEFQDAVHRERADWAARYSEDKLVLNVARTWWLGPPFDVITCWFTPGKDLERIDEWEKIATTRAMAEKERPFLRVCSVPMTGCFRPLVEPLSERNAYDGGVYYGEFIDIADGVDGKVVAEIYEQRRAENPEIRLRLLCERFGHLGPEPRGMAFWQAPSYRSLEGLAEGIRDKPPGVRIATAGLYAAVGREMPGLMLPDYA
jgi:hypothetical protein